MCDGVSKDSLNVKKSHVYLLFAIIFLVVGIMSSMIFALFSTLYSMTSVDGVTGESVFMKSSAGAASQDEEPVSADEIYKLFICSCCGRTIDAKCCGMARDMVSYVDAQVDTGLSKTDVIINTVKKYGLTALVTSMQDEVKEELERRAPAIRPKITAEPKTYDFGDVSQAKGTVSTFFTVSNEGGDTLVIDGLSTSCGCTSASLEGSPFFGMAGHAGQGASPPGWSYEIQPGGTAQLEVKYDPNVHLSFRGAATRTVYITSNDPIDFRIGVRIELNQVS